MKFLITGMSGFVGTHLSPFLNNKGHIVCGFDRKAANGDTGIDILDAKKVAEFVHKQRPDVIVHLAAQSSVKESWSDPDVTLDVNVNGTKNILNAAIGLSCRILVVSSAEVYGIPQQTPIVENHPLQPVSPYGKSRLAQEQLIGDYRKKGMRIIVARSFPHTGPGQAPTFVCSDFAQQIAKIEQGKQDPMIFVGNITVVRDFLDVRDVIQAYYGLLMKTEGTGTYNVCSGKGTSIAKVLKMLCESSQAIIKIEQDHAKLRSQDIPALVGDNSLLCTHTGWKPRILLEQTLFDLLEYWRGKKSEI